MNGLSKISLFAVFLSLSACGTMNAGFDCPNKAGVSCKSLDQVNAMVDSGQLRGHVQINTQPSAAHFTPYASHAATPWRTGATVQRMWVAPYEDAEGNYHQEGMVYTVVKDGHWIEGRPKNKRAYKD